MFFTAAVLNRPKLLRGVESFRITRGDRLWAISSLAKMAIKKPSLASACVSMNVQHLINEFSIAGWNSLIV